MTREAKLIALIDAALDEYATTRNTGAPHRARLGVHVAACLPFVRAVGLPELETLERFETAPLVQLVAALQRARRGIAPAPRPVVALPPLRPRRSRYRPGCWRRFL